MRPLSALKLKTFFAIAFAVFCFSAHAETAEAVSNIDVDAAKAFAKQNNCFRCHGTDKDKEGSAFSKIAAKFKSDPKAQEKLIKHLTSGEKSKFPDGHEEAHKKVEAAGSELDNLVKWILSL